jgi:molybdopterin molybdotransferase
VHGSFAHPILKDSGAIKSLADADGYVEIPKNTDYLEENSQILVKSFHF